jgi:ABC-2 type transport system ATP-binding protein
MLEIRDLHKRYGDVVALDGTTFSVRPGQLLGFLGPNGAGKTTAMRTVFGLVRPDAGTVTWQGRTIDQDDRIRFGYMPEQRGLYPRMKIGEQLVYFGRLHGMARGDAATAAERWLGEFGLSDRIDSRLEELSHGNQQRVQLATALVHEPDLLVLDEPFSGLDPLAVHTMTAILEREAVRGAAVLFSSHQLDLVEDLCEDVVIINEGRNALEGNVSTIRAQSPRRYLEVEIPGAGTDWVDALGSVTIVERKGDFVRMLLEDGVAIEDLLGAARANGRVSHFSYEPPNLSEIFSRAVTR